MMDFLRDVGKHFTVNYMLAKDSVSTRDGPAGRHLLHRVQLHAAAGLRLLQLYDRHGCTLQTGGSDQWGNIIAGVELIRRVRGAQRAFGLVYPLVTNADGTKFGQDRAGHDVARSQEDVAVPVLPVLAESDRRRT